MAILLIGYDVESLDIPGRGSFDSTRQFLKVASELHRECGVPGTLFIVGKNLEGNLDAFRQALENPLFEFSSHTYSHEGPVLKTVVMETDEGVYVGEGMTVEQVREEVVKTNQLLNQHLGVRCMGLRGPWGYYRGLSDRPDILRVLYHEGIRYVSSYSRNASDFTPVDMAVQPFWYAPQSLHDMLEIPAQGWQDIYIREKLGWDDLDGLVRDLKENVDLVAENDWVWGYATHDHSSVRTDPEMSVMRRLIEYALNRGVTIMSYGQYYEQMLHKRSPRASEAGKDEHSDLVTGAERSER